MNIKNSTSDDCSYFVYNWRDRNQGVALYSGDLKKGQSKAINPVGNPSGWYVVLIHRLKGGGGGIVAGGAGEADCLFDYQAGGAGNRQWWTLVVS